MQQLRLHMAWPSRRTFDGDDAAAARSGDEPARLYLDRLLEIVTKVELLPEVPEFRKELLAWQPQSYREYIAADRHGDGAGASRAYEALDPIRRRAFEAVIAGFHRLATDTIHAIALGEAADSRKLDLYAVTDAMRCLLDRAAVLLGRAGAAGAEAARCRGERRLSR
jgi:hypothetical protein